MAFVEKTDWQIICDHLDAEFRYVELQAIARQVGIVTEGKSKSQICSDLAQDYLRYSQRGKKERGCSNKDSLLGDPYDEMTDDEVVEYEEDGIKWCFTAQEVEQLHSVNPYNRKPIPTSVLQEAKSKTTRRPADIRREVHALKPQTREEKKSVKLLKEKLDTIEVPRDRLEKMSTLILRRLINFVAENIQDYNQKVKKQIILTVSVDRDDALLKLIESVPDQRFAEILISDFFAQGMGDLNEEDAQSMWLVALDAEDLQTLLNLVDNPIINPSVETDWAAKLAARDGHLELLNRLIARGVEPATDNNYLIRLAAKHGHLDIINRLLEFEGRGVNPATEGNEALSLAAKYGHLDVVNRLLEHQRVIPGKDHKALIVAAGGGHLDVVNRLIADGRIDPSANDNKALRDAAGGGHLDVVNRLLELKKVMKGSFNDVLASAVSGGNLDIVDRLLETKKVKPSEGLNLALNIAANRGHLNIVNRLLEFQEVVKEPLFESLDGAAIEGHLDVVNRLLEFKYTSSMLNHVLRHASGGGHLNIVNRLLEIKGVHPESDDSVSLRSASSGGHLDVVNRLLEFKGVNPAANGNLALRHAAGNGHLNVVNRLLEIKGVDPAAHDNEALVLAIRHGHNDVVNRLLQDERVDPTANDNEPFLEAVFRGRADIVRLLLTIPKVDPSARDNKAIQYAVENGMPNIVYILLADPRVDPSANDNFAIRKAVFFNDLEVVNRLLQDERVDPAVDDNQLLKDSIRRERPGMVLLLSDDDRVNPTPNYVRAYSWKEHKAVKMLNPKIGYDSMGTYLLIGTSESGEKLCRRVTDEQAAKFGELPPRPEKKSPAKKSPKTKTPATKKCKKTMAQLKMMKKYKTIKGRSYMNHEQLCEAMGFM